MASGRRNWPLRLGIVVAVLVGLLVAVDRIAVVVAEHIAGSSIQDSQHLSQRPDVSIDGFPFLTQLASSEYDSVQITAHDVPVGPSSRQLSIDSVAVRLHHVTTSHNFDTVHASTATADARVTFAALARTLGVNGLSSDGPGRIRASLTVTVAGRRESGTVSAAVSASTSTGLRFSGVHVDAGGLDIPALDAALSAQFRIPIPLSGLPFDIRVTGLDVDKSGLVVHFAGSNLTYSGG